MQMRACFSSASRAHCSAASERRAESIAAVATCAHAATRTAGSADADVKPLIDDATGEPNLRAVADLLELFEQIDANGDGTLEWEEFTGFIIDQGMSIKKDATGLVANPSMTRPKKAEPHQSGQTT